MKSVLKPALENLDKALLRLETAVEKRFDLTKKTKIEPQLELNARAADRGERDVSRKIASKLDQTINRLEMLLAEG